MNPGLIIIDMQEAFAGAKRGTDAFGETIGYINYVSDMFRQSGQPVIVVRDISEGDGPDYNNVTELVVKNEDIEVLKTYNNSFWKTDLEKILRDLKVDFLVLCGQAEEYCVSATYNGAVERDFEVTVLQHGVMSASEIGIMDMLYHKNFIAYNTIDYILKHI